jgi:GTP-dependent dephospho-CoA kinase
MMKVEYTLTPRLRTFLKDPFGILIKGTPKDTMDKLAKMLIEKKPTRVISVGDIVSQNMHKSGIHPQLSVIDNISRRDQELPKQPLTEKTVYVKNPPGTITDEAILAIEAALQENVHTHIVVEGEEDLLALIAILYAPKNSVVVYGQPYTGIVLSESTSEKKAQVKQFLNEMKTSKS